MFLGPLYWLIYGFYRESSWLLLFPHICLAINDNYELQQGYTESLTYLQQLGWMGRWGPFNETYWRECHETAGPRQKAKCRQKCKVRAFRSSKGQKFYG